MTVIHEKQTIIECDNCLNRRLIIPDYETYAIQEARENGWIITRNKIAICPDCQKKAVKNC